MVSRNSTQRWPSRKTALVPLLLFASLAATAARGQPPTPANAPRFQPDILPILAANCFKCHGADTHKGGLDLRTPASMLQGGDNGPVVVKGASQHSVLFEQISKRSMPPGKAAKLTDDQIRTIRDWINAAALAEQPDKAIAGVLVTEKDRQFWAFRPPARPAIPKVQHPKLVRTPIDAFILAKLEAKGLAFSPEADRLVLLRRVYFDLLGLPPAPEEVDAYLADKRPDAFERLVDRLLASPHYGERWGRHWLDAAGYCDTGSTDNDAEIITLREGLWLYRDYVVRSLNEDKPYDRFLVEQLAGDELEDGRAAPAFTPPMRDHLIATGFLRTAVDNTYERELNRPLERHEVLHRTIDNITSNLVGLTVACARCHNHKFDPIPQADYYRLMAFLTPAYNPQAWVQPQNRHLADVSPKQQETIDRRNAEINHQVGELNQVLAAVRRPVEKRLFEAKLAALPEALRADVRAAFATPAAKRSPVQKYLAGKLGPGLAVAPAEVDRTLAPAQRAKVRAIPKMIAALKAQQRSYGKIQALFDAGPPPPTYLLRRGNHLTPGPEVEPGFMTVLSTTDDASAVHSSPPRGHHAGPDSGRRMALARWLTQPDHPLTSRVIVNRIWQHHFGEGIVATPDNFGHSGARPTHPELLDWLSTELARRGWKLKALHKLIVTSTVYRQVSAPSGSTGSGGHADPEVVDPANHLLWRMRLRRVESEIFRDAVLAVSGKLDRHMGGPPIPLDVHKDGMIVVAEKGLPTAIAKWRRSLYLLARRNYPLSLLNTFDQPVMATNCTRRISSAVPLQALTLMNDAFQLEQAEHFATRVPEGAGVGLEKGVELAFRVAFARRPTPQESAWSAALLDKQTRRNLGKKLTAPQASHKALASLCHMLLCANEFLYIE